MPSLLTLVTLSFFSAVQTVLASPCVVFDSSWNLYGFGFNGKDYNAGTQGNWTTKAADLTVSGRPPFDGTNTQCYLSQFDNAIYVMGGDSANPSDVYIFNAATSSWSKQAITTGNFDPTSYNAILDHDTDVFYALSHSEMYFLNMADLKAAQSDAIAWTDVGPTPYGSSYQPVMALANNHIHFLDVPNTPAGSADIYVIHFDYFQPAAQSYGNIPAAHGQTASIFESDNLVQQEFAYIPDDGSSTYVLNVITNSSQQLAGPTIKDAKATYFASDSAIVQLSSSGSVSYLPYTPGDNSANSAASWSVVQALASVAPTTSSGSATSTATGSAGGTTATSSKSSSPTSTGKSTGSTSANAAGSLKSASRGLSLVLILGAVACLL